MGILNLPEEIAVSQGMDLSNIRVRNLFQEHWLAIEKRKMLGGMFYRLGVPMEDIPDMINETAYQACRSIDKLKNWNHFDRWVSGIAKNTYRRKCRDISYMEKKQEKITREYKMRDQDNPISVIIEKLHIDAALQDLNEVERKIIALRAVQGYDLEDISDLVGIPRSTVARYYSNALEKLRNSLCDITEGVK